MQFGLRQLLIVSVLLSLAGLSLAQDMIVTRDTTTQVDTVDAKVSLKSPRGAMLRSLAVPGWGQFYNGKWFKGIIIGGTETGLIINAIVQNQLAESADNIYDRDFYRENRSLSIWWLGGVILYSITDAFVDAHLADFDDDPIVAMNTIKDQSFDLQTCMVYQLSFNIPF